MNCISYHYLLPKSKKCSTHYTGIKDIFIYCCALINLCPELSWLLSMPMFIQFDNVYKQFACCDHVAHAYFSSFMRLSCFNRFLLWRSFLILICSWKDAWSKLVCDYLFMVTKINSFLWFMFLFNSYCLLKVFCQNVYCTFECMWCVSIYYLCLQNRAVSSWTPTCLTAGCLMY